MIAVFVICLFVLVILALGKSMYEIGFEDGFRVGVDTMAEELRRSRYEDKQREV